MNGYSPENPLWLSTKNWHKIGLLALCVALIAGCTKPKTRSVAPLIDQTPTPTAASTSTVNLEATATQTPMPTLTPPATPKLKLTYDYCQVNEESTSAEKRGAGTPEPNPHYDYLTGNLAEIKKMNLSAKDIIYSKEYRPDELQVVIVPVNYSDKEQLRLEMDNILTYMIEIFTGVPINFAYLNQSIPIGIMRWEKDATAVVWTKEQKDQLFLKIKKVWPVERMIFVVNSEDYFGGGGIDIVGSSKYYEYLLPHESAHGLCGGGDCVDDAYRAYYGKNYSKPPLNHDELFTSTQNLRPDVIPLVATLQPPIVDTGNVCQGEKVYTFYEFPSSFIMGDDAINSDAQGNLIYSAEFQDKIKDRRVFSPLQLAILTMKINEYLSHR